MVGADGTMAVLEELPADCLSVLMSFLDLHSALSTVPTSKMLHREVSRCELGWEAIFVARWPQSSFLENKTSTWKNTWRELALLAVRCRTDWMTGEVRFDTSEGHTDRVRHCRIRGGTHVTASWDHTLRVGGTAASEGGSRVMAGHGGSVFGLWFDGHHAVSCSEDSVVRVWHVASGECVAELQGHSAAVYHAEPHPLHTDLLVTASSDFVGVWRWPRERLLCKFPVEDKVHRLHVGASFIVAGSYNGTLRLFDWPADVVHAACLADGPSPPQPVLREARTVLRHGIKVETSANGVGGAGPPRLTLGGALPTPRVSPQITDMHMVQPRRDALSTFAPHAMLTTATNLGHVFLYSITERSAEEGGTSIVLKEPGSPSTSMGFGPRDGPRSPHAGKLVNCVRLDHRGLLFSAGATGALHNGGAGVLVVWCTATGNALQVVREGARHITAITLDADCLFCAYSDGRIRVRRLAVDGAAKGLEGRGDAPRVLEHSGLPAKPLAGLAGRALQLAASTDVVMRADPERCLRGFAGKPLCDVDVQGRHAIGCGMDGLVQVWSLV